MSEVKTCACCYVSKPLEEFGKSGKSNGSGYKALCKPCLALKLRDCRQANPDKVKEQEVFYHCQRS